MQPCQGRLNHHHADSVWLHAECGTCYMPPCSGRFDCYHTDSVWPYTRCCTCHVQPFQGRLNYHHTARLHHKMSQVDELVSARVDQLLTAPVWERLLLCINMLMCLAGRTCSDNTSATRYMQDTYACPAQVFCKCHGADVLSEHVVIIFALTQLLLMLTQPSGQSAAMSICQCHKPMIGNSMVS